VSARPKIVADARRSTRPRPLHRRRRRPGRIADDITSDRPGIGIGASAECMLVTDDMLGMFRRTPP
jgi:hypothetical protein